MPNDFLKSGQLKPALEKGAACPEFEKKPIYLDCAASLPLRAGVLDRMIPWLERTANPHARHHAFGQQATQAIEKARGDIERAIGAAKETIIFTSGATEANNLALLGVASHLKASDRTHIVTSQVEHQSVLAPLRRLQAEGFDVTFLPVKPCGMIEADAIRRVLRGDTGLISIQAVNNELGTIQPLAEIAALLKGRDILFHCDAAQALGKIEFDVADFALDFASLSAHKMGGPQGIGALYVRPECRSLLKPVLYGGGQEQGLRSGTLPVALCAGFGAACNNLQPDRSKMQKLRDFFIARLQAGKPIVHGHSDAAWNVPGILNLRFPGIDSETLVMALPELAFGIGSACASHGNKLSHVVTAVSGSERCAQEAIRFSFGEAMTEADIAWAAQLIIAAVAEIRNMQIDPAFQIEDAV